jgi:uncharacterized membrane protein YdbT with pleckstrin-like domain
MQTNVVLQDKPALGVILVYWTLVGFMAACVFFVVAYFMRSITLLFDMMLFFAALIIILSAGRILFDMAERQVSQYTLTDTLLMVRRGLFPQRQRTIALHSIQSVDVITPPLGHLLNYGTLVIKAPGFSFAQIEFVPNPDKWQQAIIEHLK